MFFFRTSLKGHDVLKKTKASGLRRLEDISFTSSWIRPIYDVLKTSSGRLVYDFLKTSDLRHFETSNLGHLEDVWLKRLQDVWFTTSWRRLIYVVLKTSNLRCLEDIWFMTSWRRLIYNVLKTSVKRCPCNNIVATSIQCQKKLLFLILYCLKYSENFKFFSLG